MTSGLLRTGHTVDTSSTYKIYRHMTDTEPPKSPNPADLLATVRRLASAKAIAYTDHAMERMEERDIDILDVEEVLANGELKGPVSPGRRPGQWECKVCYPPYGTKRTAGVVLAVDNGTKLVVITTEWED